MSDHYWIFVSAWLVGFLALGCYGAYAASDEDSAIISTVLAAIWPAFIVIAVVLSPFLLAYHLGQKRKP